jgi:hypothetical protein
MTTLNYTDTLTVVHCAKCSMPFGIPAQFERERREDHAFFHCPRGHNNYWPQETEAERLKRKLDERDRLLVVKNTQITDLRGQHDTLTRSNKALRAHAKSVKARVKAGVCPAGCHRHFTDLQRHIASKHPHWHEGGE